MSAVASSPPFPFCIPPAGKPDPHQPRGPGDVDARRRVPQAPQKGRLACEYYGLKLVRQQYGKQADPSFVEQRQLEAHASKYRKELLKAYEQEEAEQKLLQDFLKTRGEHGKKALSKEICQDALCHYQQHPEELAEILRNKPYYSQLQSLFSEFCAQNIFDNLEDFLASRQRENMNKATKAFFTALKLDPLRQYEEKQRIPHCLLLPWEQLDEQAKMVELRIIAFQTCYKTCYRLEASTWHPLQPIDVLIAELFRYKLLAIGGYFGEAFYQEPPIPMKEKIQGRTIWYWPRGTSRHIPQSWVQGPSHIIAIIGARKLPTGNHRVYYIDPRNGSDPQDPERQKIYAISYENLKENACNLLCKRLHDKNGKSSHSSGDPSVIPFYTRIPFALRSNRKDLS